jgi:hypothetical protein
MLFHHDDTSLAQSMSINILISEDDDRRILKMMHIVLISGGDVPQR